METSLLKQPLTSMGSHSQTLRDHVDSALRNYLSNLKGETVSNIYQLVLSEIEPPLLDAVLRHTRGNQTIAADMLGLNRGTLRKKMKEYGLM